MSLSIAGERRAMAPAARRDHVDMSLPSNPRFGTQKPTTFLGVFDIMVEVMFFHLPTGVMTLANGVEGGALWDLRWITRRIRYALRHKRGSPDALCLFLSP